MKKKVVAILDREEDYAARLMKVFNSKNRMGFQAEMFTSIEAFFEYSRKNTVEILLAGESLAAGLTGTSAEMLIVISEGTGAEELKNYPGVYKYQSSERLIRQIMECYAKEGRALTQVCHGNGKLYGIYVPQGSRCRMGFAWNLAKHLGRKQSVLYISLAAFSDKRELYIPEKELADIMYYVRHGSDNLIYMVASVVVTLEGIDCMPAVKTVEDLMHVPCGDWQKLLQVIRAQGSYEAVVVELGECVQQFYRILDDCSQIYMPYESGSQDTGVWEACEEYFRRMGAEEVWNRAKRLEVGGNYWRSGMDSIISS